MGADEIIAKLSCLSAESPDQTRRERERLTRLLVEDVTLTADPLRAGMPAPLPWTAADENQLRGKRILITGGAGAVGRSLILKLARIANVSLVSVDIASGAAMGGCRTERVDIGDGSALRGVLRRFRPEIVFHLAAIRVPAEAEAQPVESIRSNVFGTREVFEACAEENIQSVVYASSGKASRYTTADVYAGSKKIGEWLLADITQRHGRMKGISSRFCHVYEASRFLQQVRNHIAQGSADLLFHAPDQYIYIERIEDAVNLLACGPAHSERGAARILAAFDSGWPANLLDAALFEMIRADKVLPLRFVGYPPGYAEPQFAGQLPLRGPAGSPMLSWIENANGTRDGPLIQTPLEPPRQLCEALRSLEEGMTKVPSEIKRLQAELVTQIATESFRSVLPAQLLEVLVLGVAATRSETQLLSDFRDMLRALLGGLARRVTSADLRTSRLQTDLVSEALIACRNLGLPEADKVLTTLNLKRSPHG